MSPAVPAASLTWLRPEVAELQRKLNAFVADECIPAEAVLEEHLRLRHGPDRWTPDAIPPVLRQLQEKAKALGLWNMFLPTHLIPVVQRLDPSLVPTVSLSFREYGILCESLGRSPSLAPQACNCSAPDTGNMEVLLEFGTLQQQQVYGLPLLRGETRSAFLMTEPAVASR
jgi:acyl-CoA dehydrogenase